MKTQYEQQCNAVMLKSMGIPVLKKLKKKHEDKMISWIKDKSLVEVEYPDITEKIIDTIIANHAGKTFDDMVEHSSYTLFQ